MKIDLQSRAALASILVLVTLLVPGVAAEDGDLDIDAARYTGGSNQVGELTALFVANVPRGGGALEAPTAPEPASPVLELQAKRVQAVTVTREAFALPEAGGIQQPIQDPTQQPAPVWSDLENVRATTVGHQLVFQVHVLAQEEPLRYQGRNEAGRYEPLDDIYVDAGRFDETPLPATAYGATDPESEFFWDVHYPGPFVGHADEAGLVDLTLRGDFVLEIFGVTLDARHGDDLVTLASGTFETPVAPGAPLSRQATTLVRLFVEDGTLRFATHGGLPIVAWGGPVISASQDGPTTLQGARGDLERGGDLVRLEGESYLLPAGNLLRLSPSADRLGLAVQSAAPPTPTGLGPLRAALSDTALAILAVASMAVALALGAWRRWSIPPSLPRIERALSDGAYLRAARLARRLLRAEPGQEDARLARAIALTRAGRPERVIRELTQHLATQDPTDGSLHYVLGLAQLDAEQTEAGERTLAEAVRRTPALARDVKARLDPAAVVAHSAEPARMPNPAHREAHGYA